MYSLDLARVRITAIAVTTCQSASTAPWCNPERQVADSQGYAVGQVATAMKYTQIIALLSKRVLFHLPRRIHSLDTFFCCRPFRACVYFRLLVFVFFLVTHALRRAGALVLFLSKERASVFGQKGGQAFSGSQDPSLEHSLSHKTGDSAPAHTAWTRRLPMLLMATWDTACLR